MNAIEVKETNNSHVTAETQKIEANGVHFAYRSWGTETDVPTLFFQHFTGTMDNWDPAITDGIAKTRQVILFNNAGVSSSDGKTPDTAFEMADDALSFIDALGLKKLDLLGFSLGGFVAQLVAIKRPELVRKLILVGTGGQGSVGLDNLPITFSTAMEKDPLERMLYMFYTGSEFSKNRGIASVKRLQERTVGRDTDTSMDTIKAQLKAIVGWGAVQNPEYSDLTKVTQPALIINGKDDIIIPTINSYTLYRLLPNARLSLYPDSAHGALFQYPDLFVDEVTDFLKEFN